VRRSRHQFIPVATMAVALGLALPAVASASGAWVSNSAPVGANKSCSSPGYNSIQAALNAAPVEAAIHVCGGTYTEQLEITRPANLKLASGSGVAKLVMPSAPADSLTSCDTAPGLEPGQKDEVSICTSGAVSISGMQIEAVVPIATCLSGLNGVFVAGGAQLMASDDTIVGASTSLNTAKGCQHGVAVEVGSHKAAEVGHATLKDVNVSGYEKNGPTAAGAGSTLKVLDSTVTGEGASPYIAQNGIEVAFGASGQIKGTTVSANECSLAGVCSASDLEEQATGVLFFGAASGSSVSGSMIAGNDIGVYYASTNPTQPTSPEVKVTKDVLASNRYEGVVLEQGDASVTGDTINGGGEVGIDIVQSAGQPYADDSTAKHDTIEGMTSAAVGVITDALPGDPVGNFTISDSSISKNASAVENPSSTFTVTTKHDS
jgi:nitrous oxidase accessory protein NosD